MFPIYFKTYICNYQKNPTTPSRHWQRAFYALLLCNLAPSHWPILAVVYCIFVLANVSTVRHRSNNFRQADGRFLSAALIGWGGDLHRDNIIDRTQLPALREQRSHRRVVPTTSRASIFVHDRNSVNDRPRQQKALMDITLSEEKELLSSLVRFYILC